MAAGHIWSVAKADIWTDLWLFYNWALYLSTFKGEGATIEQSAFIKVQSDNIAGLFEGF